MKSKLGTGFGILKIGKFESRRTLDRQERERQERERLEKERQEREQQQKLEKQRLEQQQLLSQQQTQQSSFTMSPMKQNGTPSKKSVHFSEVDLERRQLAASNYNKPAAGFKPTQPPVQQTQSFTPPTPISKPVPSPPTPRKVNVTQERGLEMIYD